MFDIDLQDNIAKLLNLEGLNNRAKVEDDKNGNIVCVTIPQLIWIAEIQRDVFVHDDTTGTSLIVAGLQELKQGAEAGQPHITLNSPLSSFSSTLRQVILLHGRKPALSHHFSMEQLLPSLIINEHENDVIAALTHMNLTEVRRDWGFQTYDGNATGFRMMVIADPIYFELSVRSASKSQQPSLESLWNALLKTVYSLAQKYNNETLNRFIGK